MKTISRFIIVGMITFLLIGCLGSYNNTNFGYDRYYPKEFQPSFLSHDTVLIYYVSHKKVEAEPLVMRRIAEITTERGYRYFKVLRYRQFTDPCKGPVYMFSETKEIKCHMTEMKIKLLRNKSSNAYDANKITSKRQ